MYRNIIIFISTSGFVLGSIFLINFIVDPYELFDMGSAEAVSTPNCLLVSHEKLHKLYKVASLEPDTIVLGNSRSRIGIDPLYKSWGNSHVYNMSFAGADINVIRRSLEHAGAVSKLNKVVIGLDFFSFNSYRPQASDIREDFFKIAKDGSVNNGYRFKIIGASLFSISALKDSLARLNDTRTNCQVINKETGRTQSVRKNRLVDYRNVAGRRVGNEKHASRARFRKMEKLYMEHVYYSGPYRRYYFHNILTGMSSLEEFRKIIRYCRDNGIELKLFISPIHARLLEVIRVLGLWPVYEQWKREMVSVLEKEGMGDMDVLYDFSGYNYITTEQLKKKRRMNNYLDSAHYSPAIGNFIIDRVLAEGVNGEAHKFGRILNGDTIEAEIKRTRSEGKAYREKSPEDVKEINDMLNELKLDQDEVIISDQAKPIGARIFRPGQLSDPDYGIMKDLESGMSMEKVGVKYSLTLDELNVKKKQFNSKI